MTEQHPYVQEQLALTAEKRAEMNATQIDAETDKVKAHFAFGLASGVMPYLGVASEKEDFTVEVRYVVTIVTVRAENFLKVREGEVKGDIYVLYDTDPEWPAPRPVGWMWASRLKRIPSKSPGRRSCRR